MKRNHLLYPLIIGAFALFTWLIIAQGEKLPERAATPLTNAIVQPAPVAPPPAGGNVLTELLHHAQHPLAILLMQIIVVLCVSRIFGYLARKIKQPAVVGEIVAGIVLGPSLLGWLSPAAMEAIFPAGSMSNLQFLSQIGLAFFMFIVGMELDISKVRQKAHDAVMISHASIIIPFFLGVCLAYFTYRQYAPPNVNFLSFALFMGIAMSVTAFPVLARIVQERGLSSTQLGAMAITCAAADDLTAWGILAVVVAIVKSGGLLSAMVTIGLALVFVLAMLLVVRPWLKRRMSRLQGTKTKVALGFFVLLIAGYLAEVIGIHLLFGAFLAGVIIPAEANIKQVLQDKLEDVSVVILLPVFFAFTGLRTQIGLLNDGSLWMIFFFVMLVAVGGKFAGSALTARIVGQPWTEALSIGALMNTRGLMELVVLNIGYDLGILTPPVFAMLVLMALATTFMTGPALDIINSYKYKYAAKGEKALH
ncbi:cation:proton antiporter [Chitinophaga sp. GCM10012297]|uniref:Cation:proton antiporter n=1 Tax=Chitinophaga chungangae TaxID=2821488 RepID=A0ABS3YCC0_9BACT|nr:cation:proton antiporter [Chitinophaga chungangae]MBO9152331.1 cation:proton antiporter [Chitinophaga chungangae]